MTSENPAHEDDPGNHTDTATSKNSQTAPHLAPATGVSKPDIPPAPHSYQITCNAKKDWRDKIKFWAELIGLAFLIAYTVFTALMYCANKKAANAATKAATIAADTLTKTVEQFRTDERAWVEIESIKLRSVIPETPGFPNRSFIYDVFTKNVGKTVARDIDLKRVTSLDANQGSVLARGIQTAQDKLLKDQPGEPSPVPSLPMPKSLAPNIAVYRPFTLGGTAPRFRFFDYLIGRIDYNDAFGIPHWIKFCFVIIDSNGTLGICQEGNDEDRNPEITPSNQ